MPDNTFGTISGDKKTVGHSTQPFVETCKRRKFNDDILYKQQQQKLEKTLYQHQQQLSDMTKNEMSFTNTLTSHTIEKTVSSSNESSLLLPTTLSREFYGRLIRKIFWVSFFCARVKDIFWVIFSHKAFFIIAGAINLVSIFSLVVQTFLYESKTHCSSCRVKQVQPHNQNQDQNQNSGQKKK